MTVEEVLVVDEGVIVAKLSDRLVRVAIPEAAQPRVRKPLEGPPQNLKSDSLDVNNWDSLLRLCGGQQFVEERVNSFVKSGKG